MSSASYLSRSRLEIGLWISLLIATLSLLTGFAMSAWLGLEPCHLCVIQRLCYALVICMSLLGLLTQNLPWIRYLWPLWNIFFGLIGLGTAARQCWLQHLPPQEVPSCLPPLSNLLTILSPIDALTEVFKGSGDCAKIDWTFLGLSIAEYSCILFLLIIVSNIYALFTFNRLKK